jgi:hypothetical protein
MVLEPLEEQVLLAFLIAADLRPVGPTRSWPERLWNTHYLIGKRWNC